MWVCGCVCTKNPDRNDLKLVSVGLVVIDTMLKSIDFGFKRSRVRGTGSVTWVFRDCRRAHDEKRLYLSTPDVIRSNFAFGVGVNLHLH